MIRLQNVTKRFGSKPAVDDISFEVAQGEKLVLLGTSGCGKTTTLRMINRLIEPDAGTIWVNDKNIHQQHPEILRRSIGYVLQHHGLFPHYTVAENIAVVPELLKWNQQKIKERTNLLLEKLHVSPLQFSKLYPHELSGGQQQRIGVARALAADPPVLLMDEPFGALDPVTRNDIKNELLGLDEFNRKTIIMVTHDVQEAFEIGDRICLMDKGKIIQLGAPSQLLFKPANNFVKNFLDAQRLLLEYKSVTLADIAGSLPKASTPANEIALTSAGMDLWQAVEMLTNSEKSLYVKDEAGLIKEAALPDLLQAFKQLKHHPV